MFRKANKSFVGGLRSCVFLFKRRQFIKWYERFPNNIWLFIIIMIEAWKVPKCKQHRKELYHEKIIVLIWIISTFISLVGCSSINNSEAPLPTSSSSKEINSDSKEPNSPILPTTPDDTTEPEHPSKKRRWQLHGLFRGFRSAVRFFQSWFYKHIETWGI